MARAGLEPFLVWALQGMEGWASKRGRAEENLVALRALLKDASRPLFHEKLEDME